MKRYIKLSLLLLLIPLFAQNVYAKELIDEKDLSQIEIIDKVEENKIITLEDDGEILEEYEFDEENDKVEESNDNTEDKVSTDDIKTGSSEDISNVSLEEILNSIDSLYDIDLNETDNFTSKVKELLRNIIDEKLNKNNFDLEKLGYSYELIWNYLENDKVDSYTLIISDKNNKRLNKDLTIKYINSINKNESDSKKIDEFLENNNLNYSKEYTLEEILSNNTINLNTYLTSKFENIGINFFIANNINTINKDFSLSNTSIEKVILSINEIIYKTLDIEDKYTTIIEVPIEEDKTSFIENTLKEKLIEYELITNETIKYNKEENEIYLINNDSETLLGSITIREIKKDYIITTGANSTINETDNLRIGIVSDLNEFKRIEVNNVELNPNYYSISNKEIVINNEFIKSLNKGTYNLEVIYKTGRVKTTFNLTSIPTNTRPAIQQTIASKPNYTYRPNYIVNSNYQNNNNMTNELDDNKDAIANDEEKQNEETNDEEENNKSDDDKDIDLGAILEDNKDNNIVDDSEDKVKDNNNKTGFLATLKSSIVPIIIVVVVILIGGVTIYVFFKAKEEHIL